MRSANGSFARTPPNSPRTPPPKNGLFANGSPAAAPPAFFFLPFFEGSSVSPPRPSGSFSGFGSRGGRVTKTRGGGGGAFFLRPAFFAGAEDGASGLRREIGGSGVGEDVREEGGSTGGGARSFSMARKMGGGSEGGAPSRRRARAPALRLGEVAEGVVQERFGGLVHRSRGEARATVAREGGGEKCKPTLMIPRRMTTRAARSPPRAARPFRPANCRRWSPRHLSSLGVPRALAPAPASPRHARAPFRRPRCRLARARRAPTPVRAAPRNRPAARRALPTSPIASSSRGVVAAARSRRAAAPASSTPSTQPPPPRPRDPRAATVLALRASPPCRSASPPAPHARTPTRSPPHRRRTPPQRRLPPPPPSSPRRHLLPPDPLPRSDTGTNWSVVVSGAYRRRARRSPGGLRAEGRLRA